MPMDTMDPLSRRQFLRTLTVVGAAALLPPAAMADTAPAAPAPAAPIPAAPIPAAPIPVGADADFKEGDFKPVTLPGPDGRLIFVGRQSGKLVALSSVCTHRGCAVAWTADQKQFVCPCHNGRFDATGAVVGGPPKRPLPTYPVAVTAGKVTVQA